MPTPKSVTKIKTKQGQSYVEYVSECDKTQYYLFELNRAALRDVAKFVKKKFAEGFSANFKKHTGKSKTVTKYRVFSNKNTKYPRMEIGLKRSTDAGFYAYFQEVGDSSGNIPKLGLLQNAVKNNISQIIDIESQYLSSLSDSSRNIESKIAEKEYTSEEDGDV